MPSLPASLDQIPKISRVEVFIYYLFICLFIEKEKRFGINTYSKLSKNVLTYSIMCCFTVV